MNFKLRKFKLSDANYLRNLLNDPAIHKFTSNIPYPYTEKDAMNWINYAIKLYKQKQPQAVHYAIEIEKNIAGAIGFNKISLKHRNAELGFWLGKDYRKKGIMAKAVKKMLCYGFTNMKLKRIHAFTYDFNVASQKTLLKAGFEKEGELKKYIYKNGKYLNCFIFSKIK